MEAARQYDERLQVLLAEYNGKVSYDFSRYLFVRSRTGGLLEDAISIVTSCPGYEAHRMVFYREHWPVLMYVRFRDRVDAEEAAQVLVAQNPPSYIATGIDEFLRSLYCYEMISGSFPSWTLTIVDTVGPVQMTRPLSDDTISGMLKQYGDFRVYPCNSTLPHLRVLFPSMSEALGASISRGPWLRGNTLETGGYFFYRVRVVGSEKESELFKAFDVFSDAFELDYFVPSETNDPNLRNRRYCNIRPNLFGYARPTYREEHIPSRGHRSTFRSSEYRRYPTPNRE